LIKAGCLVSVNAFNNESSIGGLVSWSTVVFSNWDKIPSVVEGASCWAFSLGFGVDVALVPFGLGSWGNDLHWVAEVIDKKWNWLIPLASILIANIHGCNCSTETDSILILRVNRHMSASVDLS